MSIASARATLADLMKTEGKAELIGGRIVQFMATGIRPSRVASRIFRSLDDFASSAGRGHAFSDNIGYAVPELSSGRESFSPDASFSFGPIPENSMDFVQGVPALAVEVRSKGDFTPAAEAEMAEKRSDYFEAGTPIVWDVDPVANVIRAYSAKSPDTPIEFRPGQTANAEPTIAGWTIDVTDLFRE